MFFLSYQYRPLPGYAWDNRLANVASVMAVGVALFPTANDAMNASVGVKSVAVVHLACAATLFILLGVLSMFFFTRTDDPAAMTDRKRRRNIVYRVCGSVIFTAIALVILTEIARPPGSWHVFLALETIMVVAFGVSWLVKGGFLHVLADDHVR